jgi:uncharacterized protein YjbJ (UPF0337 family)
MWCHHDNEAISLTIAHHRVSDDIELPWSGRAKETVGRVTGNRRTRYEGKPDQVKANLKDTGERARGTFKR